MWGCIPRAGPHTPASEATIVAGVGARSDGGGGIAAQRVVPCIATRSPQLASCATPRRRVRGMPARCAHLRVSTAMGNAMSISAFADYERALVAMLTRGLGGPDPTSRIPPGTFA